MVLVGFSVNVFFQAFKGEIKEKMKRSEVDSTGFVNAESISG